MAAVRRNARVTEAGLIQTTVEGRRLLDELVLYEPEAPAPIVEPTPPAPRRSERAVRQAPTRDDVEDLIEAMISSATDSRNPDRFERAARDAFAFLGFRAEWLGGPGGPTSC